MAGYLGQVSLGGGGGGYLGEVSVTGGIIPTSIPIGIPVTGGSAGAILVEDAAQNLGIVAAVAAGRVLIAGGVGTPPSYAVDLSFDDATNTLTAGDELTFIQSATQCYARPQQILGVTVKGANMNFESGKGSQGTGVAVGGEGGDCHLFAGDGGGDGGAGVGRGGSLSIDCGDGVAGTGEPHMSIGTRARTHSLNLGHSALTGLNLTGPINPTGSINHTGAAFASVVTGAHTLVSGAASSWTVTGGLNLIASGNLGLFASQLDLVANSYRFFTSAITLASTCTPSSLGLLFTNNIALGGLAAGTTAAGVFCFGNAATAPTVATDRAQIWGRDIAAGRASFAWLTEEAINADAALVSTHSGQIQWNGSTYKIPLVFVSTP